MKTAVQCLLSCFLAAAFLFSPYQAARAQQAQPAATAQAAPIISAGRPISPGGDASALGGVFNMNLIPDGDAEYASYLNYWADNEGYSRICRYGAACGSTSTFPSPYDPGPTVRGSSFYYMGETTNHSAQTNLWIKNKIPLAPIQQAIDTGKVRYIVSGYFGGYGSQTDTARLQLFFENPGYPNTAEFSIGDVTAVERQNKTALLYRQRTGFVPKGTKYINMVLQSGTLSGSNYRTGFADNLSLILLPLQTFLPLVQTSAANQPPQAGYPAPSGILVAPNGLTRMEIKWTDNTSDELGFEVQRINSDATVDTICQTRPNVTTCLDPGLFSRVQGGYGYLGSGRLYTYQVRAIGPSVNSGWASGSGTTATMPAIVPSLKSNASFTCQSLGTTSTSTTFVWNDPFNYEAGFALYLNGKASPDYLMLEGGTKVSFINQVPGSTITLKMVPFIYDLNNPGYILVPTAANASCTAQAVLPAPASSGVSHFTNSASYPVVSLVVDGWEQFPARPLGILPGAYYELTGVPAGQHTWTATTGFWDDFGRRFEMYKYSGSYNQGASGRATIAIPDMTINNLLSVPPANTGYWEGYYWDANSTCHTAAFKFSPSGSYTFYAGNSAQGSGTYSLVTREPAIFSVKFHVSGLPSGTDALLVETHGMFYLRNGPPSWPQITYVFKPQGYVYNAFCP